MEDITSTTDLTALVLFLEPTEPVMTPGHLGQAAYKLLLDLIGDADPELAARLHDSPERKPFTCSTLVGGQRVDRNARRFEPEQPAWLRFTGLNKAVSTRLQQLAADPPAQVELNNVRFQVKQATLSPEEHSWAGQSSYEALAAPYLLARRDPSYRLRLSLASPTTFRSNGQSHPVPVPGRVFGSLMDRWQFFSNVVLAQDGRQFAETSVVLSRYRLKTQAIPVRARLVQVGCVGQAQYVLLERDRYWAGVLNVLADYAFYSGVGYQTTIGMGQARRHGNQRSVEQQ